MKETLKKQENIFILLALLIISIYLSPLFILGENAHIRVHDNLDSNIAWYKVLANSGQLFSGVEATIPQIINGLPRNAFGSEFSGIVWLYVLFPTMTAYGISQAITRFFAFIGMYLLLKDHFLTDSKYSINPCRDRTRIFADSFLAIWNAQYAGDAAGAMGFYEY